MFKFLTRWAEYNRVYAEMAGMTDRELTELGISRTDIRTLAKESAHMLA